MWTDQPHTMRLTYQDISQDAEYPWLPLGNFMNDFFRNFADQREMLVREPIQEPEHPTAEQHQWAVYCAAAVEFLCEKYGLATPTWVNDERYAPLEEPWFMVPDEELSRPLVREYLERSTPISFAKRNIYNGDRDFLDKREEAAKLRRLLKTA